MNSHEITSKAFLQYIRIRKISLFSVIDSNEISKVKLVFSPIK